MSLPGAFTFSRPTVRQSAFLARITKQTGTCIYCGQTMILNTSGKADKEQLDKWATEKCSCAEAKAAQEKVKVKRTAEDNIVRMFRDDFPETEAIMKSALVYVENEDVLKVTVDTGNGVKGILRRTNKGTIVVEMVTSKKRTMESQSE